MRLQAWRLLARGFGLGEQAPKVDVPVVLPLADLAEGLKTMGLGDDDMKASAIDPSVMFETEDDLEEEQAFDA